MIIEDRRGVRTSRQNGYCILIGFELLIFIDLMLSSNSSECMGLKRYTGSMV